MSKGSVEWAQARVCTAWRSKSPCTHPGYPAIVLQLQPRESNADSQLEQDLGLSRRAACRKKLVGVTGAGGSGRCDARGDVAAGIYALFRDGYTALGEDKNLEKVIGMYKQSRVLSGESGDRASQGLTCRNLGGCFERLCQDRKAVEMYEQCL